MKDYGNKDSWTKLFTVPYREFIYYNYANLFCINIEHDQVWLYVCDKVYVYNFKNGTLKIPEIQGSAIIRFSSNIYVESLISP